jgi:membrane protein implicated in regulation of membrane protease activity
MEADVTEGPGVDQVLDGCTRYWEETHVPPSVVADMRRELASHLTEAAGAGKTPSNVIGDDIATFAESWAAVHRGPRRRPSPGDVRRQGRNSRGWSVWAIALIAIVAAIAWLGPEEVDVEDMEWWRWFWVGAVVVLGVGEMVTAGFFMLPFAIGAAAALVLSFFDVAIWFQLTAFLVVSILALIGMRRFAHSDNEPSYHVGAKRYVDATATVLEPIDRVTGSGRVRLETQEWRATTDLDGVIDRGVEVRVVDVRGARLVVEPRA